MHKFKVSIISILLITALGCQAQFEPVLDADLEKNSDQDYAFYIWQLEFPEKIAAGESATVPLKVINVGQKSWSSENGKRYYISYHWKKPNGKFNAAMFRGKRSPLPAFVGPGELVESEISVDALSKPGLYALTIDIVYGAEAVSKKGMWFEAEGWKTHDLLVEITEDE